MQSHKRVSVQIPAHAVSSAVQVADNDYRVAPEYRTHVVISQEPDVIAEDLPSGAMDASGDCVACFKPPARLAIVFIDPPAETIVPELLLFFGIVVASWVNAAVYILA